MTGALPAPKCTLSPRTSEWPSLPCFEKRHKNRESLFEQREPRSKAVSCLPWASISAGCREGRMLLILIEDAAGGPSVTDTYRSQDVTLTFVRLEVFLPNSKGDIPPPPGWAA